MQFYILYDIDSNKYTNLVIVRIDQFYWSLILYYVSTIVYITHFGVYRCVVIGTWTMALVWIEILMGYATFLEEIFQVFKDIDLVQVSLPIYNYML